MSKKKSITWETGYAQGRLDALRSYQAEQDRVVLEALGRVEAGVRDALEDGHELREVLWVIRHVAADWGINDE